MRVWCLRCLALLSLSPCLPVRASFIHLTTLGGDGHTLDTLSLNRGGSPVTYSYSDLIGVDLVSFAGSTSTLLLGSGQSVPAPGSRASLIEDARLDNGIINPNRSPDDVMTFQFLTPVINAAGEDLVLFEIAGTNATIFEPDRGLITIAGVGRAIGLAVNDLPWTDTGLRMSYSGVGAASTTVDSLTELETDTFTSSGAATQNLAYIGLDFSDFGVAPGAFVSGFSLRSASTGNTIDPVFAAGLPNIVPEPASLHLLLSGGILILLLRRQIIRP